MPPTNKGFQLTAELVLRGPRPDQLRSVRRRIQNVLGNVNAQVNVRMNRRLTGNIRNLNRQLIQLNRNFVNISKSGKAAGTAITNVSNAINKLTAALGKSITAQQKQNQNYKQASTEIAEFGRQSALAIRRYAAFTVATSVTFGFLRAVTDATKQAIAFERELVKVAQVTGLSLTSMGALSTEITRLATAWGTSSAELVTVAKTLAQAGLSANDTRVALEALAKSTLAPTFGDIKTTTEGAIAAMRQFGLSAEDLEGALGAINAVAGQFAVESDDLVAAIRRAGGVFSAMSKGVHEGQEALDRFIALFTSVRATTRESAETIATGLRTIFTRIQRGSTIQFLRQFNIELQNSQGQFVGAYNAIDRLSEGLKQLDPRDIRFARIIEELGGFRQVGKVIPLIQQFATAEDALKVAQEGRTSITEDAIQATQTLAVQFAQVREEFLALIRDIAGTETFKVLTQTLIQLARTLIDVGDAIKPLIPLFAVLGGIKAISGIKQFAGAFFAQGGIRKFQHGGYVGGSGSGDIVPALLEPGEFVLRRKAVQALGGRGYQEGGLVREKQIGAAVLKPSGYSANSKVSYSIRGKTKTWDLIRRGLKPDFYKRYQQGIDRGIIASANASIAALGYPPLERGQHEHYMASLNEGTRGNLFENMLSIVSRRGIFSKAEDPKRAFDFSAGISNTLSGQFVSGLKGIRFIDAKASDTASAPAEMRTKIKKQLENEGVLKPVRQKGTKPATRGYGPLDISRLKDLAAGKDVSAPVATLKKFTSVPTGLGLGEHRALARNLIRSRNLQIGGMIAGTSLVPAMLEPGEFVVSKDVAQRLGRRKLEELNQADRSLYLPETLRHRTGFKAGGAVGKSAYHYYGRKPSSGFYLPQHVRTRTRFALGGLVIPAAKAALPKLLKYGKSGATRAGQSGIGDALTLALAGQFLGGESPTGQAITGGLTGAAVGTALPAGKFRAFGRVIFGATAAVKSFQDATEEEAQKIGEANLSQAVKNIGNELQKEFSEVDVTFLNKSLEAAVKTSVGPGKLKTGRGLFRSLGDIIGGQFKAAGSKKGLIGDALGVGAGLYAAPGATSLIGLGVGAGAGAGSILSLPGLAGTAAIAGLAVPAFIGGGIAAGVNTIINNKEIVGNIARTQAVATRDEVGLRGSELFQTQSGAAEKSRDLIEQLLRSGREGEIGKGLTGAVAFANVTKDILGERRALNFASTIATMEKAGKTQEEIAKAIAHQGRLNVEVLKMEQTEKEKNARLERERTQQVNAAYLQLVNRLSTFELQVKKVGDLADRINNRQTQFGSVGAGLIEQAGGKFRLRGPNDINVFKNIGASNVNEVGRAFGRIRGAGGRGSIIDQLQNTVIQGQLLKENVGLGLRAVAARANISKDSQAQQAASILDSPVFKDIPKVIRDKIQQEITDLDFERTKEEIGSKIQGIEKSVANAIDPAIKAAEQLFNAIVQAEKKLDENLNQRNLIEQKLNTGLSNIQQTRLRSEQFLADVSGRELSLREKLRPEQEKVRSLTGGSLNAREIYNNIRQGMIDARQIEGQRREARLGGRTDEYIALSAALADTNLGLTYNTKALEALSKNTLGLSQIQGELAKSQQQREASRSALGQLTKIVSDPDTAFQFAANQAALEGVLTGDRRLTNNPVALIRAMEALEGPLGQLLGAGRNPEQLEGMRAEIGRQMGTILEPVLRNMGFNRDAINRIQNLAGTPRQAGTNEEQRLRQQAQEAFNNQILAQQALNMLQEQVLAQFDKNSLNQFYDAAVQLHAGVQEISKISIPDRIEVMHGGDVRVNINGAEVFAEMEPALKGMIEGKVALMLHRHFNADGSTRDFQ